MLHYKNGDLLESDCTIIMHQANCFSIMGAGIALAIAEKYPLAAIADKECPYKPEYRFGKFSYAVNDNGVTVANLYGQYELGHVKGEKLEERMMKLDSALNFFLYTVQAGRGTKDVNATKIGVPYKMGCALAGGDWNIVREILKRASERHQVDIYIYKL